MHVQNLVKFHQFILKILSGNEIPTSIKRHNSVICEKLIPNNPNLAVFHINAYAKFGQIPSVISQDIERLQNTTSIKGHNSVINEWTLTHNNSSLDLININAKFGQIPSICSKYWAQTKFRHGSRAITLL